MAIENTYLLGKNITLGCGFDLQAKAPLDSRQVVPAFAGLQALIDNNAAYHGMIVFDEETKKTYQAQIVDDVLKFREFGINEAELKDLIASETTAAMEFKGAATALPENPAKGDMYKVTAAFKIGEEDAKIGDSIVYDGEQWFIIPSGDDIEDTWRPVTGVDNDATLTFAAGDKLEKTVAADGTITYKHVAIDAPTNMNEEGDDQTRTYITQLITDNHGHIIGFKTATENVEDTNTTYEFEGLPVVEGEAAPSSVYFQVKSSEDETAEVIYLDAYNKNEANAELAKKVDKLEGYSLVSDAEIERLSEVDNYNDEEVRGLIGDNAKAIEDLEAYVGTIPNVPGEDGNNKYADLDVIGYINKKAQETLAAASGNSTETAASVKGQLDDYIGSNNTRVKDIEDDVAAIKDAETGILKQAQDYADGLASNYDEAGAAAGVKSELEVEIAKKVDKVEGKDLIATSEIERLTTLHNYDDTQVKEDIAKKADSETMTTELGKKVDKIEGYSLVSDTEIARLAEVDNYDDTVLAGRVTTAEGKITALETASETYALKTEVEAVDKKFENYVTSASYTTDKQGIDAAIADRYTKEESDGKYALKGADAYDDTALSNRVKAIEDDYLKGEHKTELEGKINLKADKSVVDAMYTNEQIDGFIAEAKKHADDNDADTKYGIVYDSDNKKIKLVEGGTDVEIDASAFIKDGMINTVTIDENDDLIITFNTDSGKENIVLPLDQLVDIYTGVEGDRIKVTVNADKSISADLTDSVKASLALADSALQSHQDISHLATKDELNGAKDELSAAIETAKTEAANQDAVVLSESQKYADTAKADAIADAASKYETIGTAQGIVDGLNLSETYEPKGAEARAIADAEGKVNALAGEGNTSTVKKNADDIANLFEMFQWGSF